MASVKILLWRYGLSVCLLASPAIVAAQGSSGSIGDGVVAYLNSHLDQRVGGGSAWHMGAEALRVAGGEFIPAELGADFPWEGDRVWGTLVTKISYDGGVSDSAPESAVLPGDLIQLHSAEFGTLALPVHFTGVVAEVNGSGRPTSVFYQNLNRVRKVQKVNFDATALTSGWMRIYRPKARIDRLDEWKFTVVNNFAAQQGYDVLVGIDVESTNALSVSNSYDSYRVHWIITDGTVPNLLRHSGGSYFLETGKGYEVPSTAGTTGFKQLSE